MRRLSLRLRLVAGFAAAMVVVLSAAGVFVYWQVKTALDRELNAELVATSARLVSLVDRNGALRNRSALLSGEGYQVLDADGKVLSESTGAGVALLRPDTLRKALTEPVLSDVGELLPENSQSLRVYATPLSRAQPGPAAVLVVTLTRSQRDEALRELLLQLTIAGLATLLVTTVVGERLAKSSLIPVERYRRQAIEVTEGASGVRLDVPPDRDDEITRLGHSLNRMLQTLEDAFEHERRFIDDASHELRTPLTVLGTRVQLARRRSRTVEEHERVLDEIIVDIERLVELADQLLDIRTQRVSTGTEETTDLAAVVREQVARRLLPAAVDSASGLEIAQIGTARPAYVYASRAALDRMLSNLLDNAAKHGRPPVSVAVTCIDGFVVMTVRDSGAGMDAEMLATAPDRFVRAAEARSRPGSGLGLALVKAIVLAASGEMRLCSAGRHERFGSPTPIPCDHGPGMAVTVVLPQATAPDDRELAPATRDSDLSARR